MWWPASLSGTQDAPTTSCLWTSSRTCGRDQISSQHSSSEEVHAPPKSLAAYWRHKGCKDNRDIHRAHHPQSVEARELQACILWELLQIQHWRQYCEYPITSVNNILRPTCWTWAHTHPFRWWWLLLYTTLYFKFELWRHVRLEKPLHLSGEGSWQWCSGCNCDLFSYQCYFVVRIIISK